jgi:hypothetical protein
MKSKRTRWFKKDQLPVQAGLYLTRNTGFSTGKLFEPITIWRAFDGKVWYEGIPAKTRFFINSAPSYKSELKRSQKIETVDFEWCGLTDKTE